MTGSLRVLVVGGGGREHALGWKIAGSPLVAAVLFAPGNAGTAEVGENIPVAADDVAGLVAACRARGVGLVVVGPEAPLVAGLADRLLEAGVPAVGPCAGAAQIEGSKAFAKEVMARAGVPTAAHAVFDDANAAAVWLAKRPADRPWVVKADGLAAGKGVTVCDDAGRALAAVRACLEGAHGDAGRTVLIEERLAGVETSYMVVTDGRTLLPLPTSMDHKRLRDGDAGPNTGGMGAVSPSPHLRPDAERWVLDQVMGPVVAALSSGDTPYRGFLYAGLMLGPGGPRVLEFNCRLGDPEAQALMLRLDGDLVPALLAAAGAPGAPPLAEAARAGGLHTSPDAAAVVVMAAPGYPGAHERDGEISGVPSAGDVVGVRVFHGGTRRDAGGALLTAGGRVLGVAARAPSLPAAVTRAYAGVARISFPGAQFRRDIGGA